MKKFNLRLFDWTVRTDPGTLEVNPVNRTTDNTPGNDFSPTMKTFYDTSLLENAREAMVFTQLGRKQPMKGNKVEWRKFNTFKKALTPLTEGVIPEGEKFGMTKIEATTTQHGDYTPVSDRLELESYDDVIYGASEEMGAAGGETYDTLTRNIIVAGNSVAYCPTISGSTATAVTSRSGLDKTAVLTPKVINKAVTFLKKNKAPRFSGNTYAAIIHPSVAEDLRESAEWKEFHKYADVDPIFKGEIGTLHGCRFIESNEAKIWRGEDLTAGSRTLSIKTAVSASTTAAVKEAISDTEATALAGRTIMDADGNVYTISSATAGAAGSASLTLSASATIAKDAVLYPTGGGAEGSSVYATLFMGKDAFGVLEPQGESFEMIVKDRNQIGGPLNQFSTIGYKFNHGAKILYQERLLRVESGSSYDDADEEN